MPLDLTDDRRHGVGLEEDPSRDVEAVDRLDHTDRCDLDEVLERFAPPRVATGDRARERETGLDEPVARALLSVLVVGAEKLRLLAAG